MPPQIQLIDIIDADALSSIQNILSRVTGLASWIIDLQGNPIVAPGEMNPFCRFLRKSAARTAFCRVVDRGIENDTIKSRTQIIRECGTLGLVSACAPIIVDGRQIANWKMGQAIRVKYSDGDVRRFARKYGLPEDEAVAAYRATPVLNDEQVDNALALLQVLTQRLSESGYKNFLLQKTSLEKERIFSMLKIVMDNVDAFIYVNDPKTFKLVYVNEYTRTIVNKGPLEGRLCYEVFQGRTSQCPFCPHFELAAGKKTVVRREIRNEWLQRNLMTSGRLVPWYDGNIMHMEVAADITERHALAAARAGTKAKQDFLARMSHELRTPMNGVLGMTHLALHADPPPIQKEYLKKIQASASLLLGIINDILDISRIEDGHMTLERQPFNLREAITTTTELVMPTVTEKNLTFKVDVDPQTPLFAMGDQLRFSQILLNLLGNAVKFTQTGAIFLKLAAIPDGQGKLRVTCAVQDTGIGMDPSQIASLFAPFTQADPSVTRRFGGTGLGLAITKSLVELMQGTIKVTSKVGMGSTFHVTLHLDEMKGPAPEAASHGETEAVYCNKKILVVEDNAINQEVITSLLKEMGLRADLAENGKKGLQAFLEKDYDLIFMDIRMPVMDGLEAARRIRSSKKHDAETVPVIAMTANAMSEDKTACTQAGMNAHIAKPIVVDELAAVLAKYLTAGRKTVTVS